jgi:outer membrane protein assembly factor BamB
VVRYIFAQGTHCFVAENQLTKYDVQAARGQLKPQWIRHERDVFVQPLQAAGECVVHARARPGFAGVLLTAARLDDGAPVWEVQLGTPLAGRPLIAADGARVTALTASGAICTPELPRDATAIASAAARVELSEPLPADTLSAAIDGRVIFAAPAMGDRLLAFEPAESAAQVRWVSVPGPLGARPVVQGSQLLVPLRSGEVCLVDPATGATTVEPFQPRLEAGMSPQWAAPAVLPDGRAILADRSGSLYCLAVAEQPLPHLAAQAEAAAPAALAGDPAVVEETVYAATQDGRILSWRLPQLTVGREWTLGSTVAWGPVRVADRVLAASDSKLFCFDANAEQLWSVALPHGALAGAPLADGDALVLASIDGHVWSVDLATGAAGTVLYVGQPLADGPLAADDRWLLVARDGSLLLLDPFRLATADPE